MFYYYYYYYYYYSRPRTLRKVLPGGKKRSEASRLQWPSSLGGGERH